MASQDIPNDAPCPRSCHVIKWPEFDGYGFNLHTDRTRPGQYIGKVDKGSPAESAGLRERDRIIEVNGVNISNENHKQVVERIKSKKNETILLVLDDAADMYYREKEIIVRGDQKNVIHQQTTASGSQKTPSVNGDAIETSSTSTAEETNESPENPAEEEEASEERSEASEEPSPPPAYRQIVDKSSESDKEKESLRSDCSDNSSTEQKELPIVEKPETPVKQVEPVVAPKKTDMGGLNLNMTAAQLREQLSKSKRPDPRKDKQLDWKQKYDIVQTL